MLIRRSVPARFPTVLAIFAMLTSLAAVLAGCTGPIHHRATAFIDPPRDEVQASLATEQIKVSDVLQFKVLGESTAAVNGTYEVTPDGTIQVSGGVRVRVAGKTIEEARQAVRDALTAAGAIEQAIELARYDYYLVTVTADGVRNLARVPLRGKVTVKDAVANVPRLTNKVLWVARPIPASGQSASLKEQALAVDWEAISHGDNATNYALQPGDFLFVADEPARGVGRLFGAVTSMLTPARQPSAQETAKK